jgi:hypothetical protein
MNQAKVLAIVFSVLSFGSLQETFRIFTSSDSDIAQNRDGLIPVAIIMTGLFIFLAIWFWLKSANSKKR